MRSFSNSTFYHFLNDFCRVTLLCYSIGLCLYNGFSWSFYFFVQTIIFAALFTYFLFRSRSLKLTRIFILGFLTQLLIFDFSKLSIFSLNPDPTDTEINTYIIRLLFELAIFVLICSVFTAFSKTPVIMKLVFYVLIALITFLFQFMIQTIDCFALDSYVEYRKCKMAFQKYELFKNNTLNILVICISLFEALSNGIDLITSRNKNKDKER